MRCLVRTVVCDIKASVFTLALPCALGLLLAIFTSLSMVVRLRGMEGAGAIESAFSVGDAILISIAGALPPDAVSRQGMRAPDIPFDWLLLMMLLAYMAIVYPMRDREGFGSLVMVASGRRVWWLSKCVWVCLSAAGLLGIFFGAVAICALAFGAEPTLSWNADVFAGMVANSIPHQGSSHDVLHALTVFVLVVWTVQIVRLLCSLIVSPVIAFGLSMGLAACSYFIRTPMLLENYLMTSRMSSICSDGLDMGIGAPLLLVYCFALVAGDRFARNMDVFSRRNS